jgi:hypothetical protein
MFHGVGRLLIVVVATICLPGAGQESVAPPASQPDHADTIRDQPRMGAQAARQEFQKLPWAVKLGMRSLEVEQAFPLIDRVVLVPDAATYVDELSKWSPRGRWPVLFDEGRYAPMFVRRFQPAQLYRRESVNDDWRSKDKLTRQRVLESVVIKTFSGNPAQHTLRETFASQGFTPAGIVVCTVDDPAWTAGVALAAGHGQVLAWLDERFGAPNDVMEDGAAQRLIAAVESLLSKEPYAWKELGDEIDAITICRDMAVKADIILPPAVKANVGGQYAVGPCALTDLIGRDVAASGSRYAVCGWVFGSEARCAYAAMCSLFLSRERLWLHNTYSEDGALGSYGMAEAQTTLRQSGFTASSFGARDADISAWQRMLIGGISTDLLMMNTKGYTDFFDLSTGQAHPQDVPVLNTPLALHLAHSWSLSAPANAATVGGAWLERGAYAMVGSSYEPYLQAFVPPALLARRITSIVPFLPGSRWWNDEGPFSKAWRIVTIGDPLMVLPPPGKYVKQRVKGDAPPTRGYVDLHESVKALMREALSDESAGAGKAEGGGEAAGPGKKLAQAMSILDMLGKDDVAVQFWRLAGANGRAGAAAARAALPALFRQREVEAFTKAWDMLSRELRDDLAVTMLWHLFEPRLAGAGAGAAGVDDNALIQLQMNIRGPAPQFDLERLAPHLVRRFGKAHALGVIERELTKFPPGPPGPSAEAHQKLSEMVKQYR